MYEISEHPRLEVKDGAEFYFFGVVDFWVHVFIIRSLAWNLTKAKAVARRWNVG